MLSLAPVDVYVSSILILRRVSEANKLPNIQSFRDYVKSNSIWDHTNINIPFDFASKGILFLCKIKRIKRNTFWCKIKSIKRNTFWCKMKRIIVSKFHCDQMNGSWFEISRNQSLKNRESIP